MNNPFRGLPPHIANTATARLAKERMSLPIVESTPSNGSVTQPGAEHKSFNVKSLAAEAKARFGDNPTKSADGSAPATIPPPTTSASQPAVIPPPVAPPVQPRTSPSSREYLTPSQATQQTVVPAGGEQPQPQAVQGADPGKTPEQQILEIPDDAYVRVPVNGELKLMKGADAKRQMMLHSDYTRKTQELAQQRRAIQPFVEAAGGDPRRAQELLQAATEAPQLRTILSDADMLERYLRYTNHPVLARLTQTPQAAAGQPATTPQTPSVNPDELASLGEVEQVVGQRAAGLEQRLAEAIAELKRVEAGVTTVVDQKLQFLDNAREASRIKGELASTITDAVKAHPVLKVIPNIQRDVLQEVKKMGPRNEEEVLQATGIVLQAFLENANATYESIYQNKALQRQEVLTQGIEPSTGTTHTLQPQTSFVNPGTGKFDFGLMRQAARGYGRK